MMRSTGVARDEDTELEKSLCRSTSAWMMRGYTHSTEIMRCPLNVESSMMVAEHCSNSTVVSLVVLYIICLSFCLAS